MIQILLVLIVIGALVAVLNCFFPIDARFLKAIGIIIGAALLIWVIQMLLGGGFPVSPIFPVRR